MDFTCDCSDVVMMLVNSWSFSDGDWHDGGGGDGDGDGDDDGISDNGGGLWWCWMEDCNGVGTGN